MVLAHPDDEVLALGARLERLAHSTLMTLTDGAPPDGADARHHGFTSLEAYRAARQTELHAALADAGLPPRVVATLPAPLPVPDQAAALHLAALTRAVAAAIGRLAPEAILTHPYEGGHPDHDACAFATHTAVRLHQKLRVAGQPGAAGPVLIEAPFYHAGEDGFMRTGAFLAGSVPTPTVIRALSPAEQDRKRARLACFRSQAETLAQFGTERELFRIAPVYDFTQPPHLGELLYERFGWGMTGTRFRALAAATLAELFPGGGKQPVCAVPAPMEP